MDLLLQDAKESPYLCSHPVHILLMSTYEYDVDPSKPHKYYSPADEHGQSCVPVSNEHLRANENNHVSSPVRNENAKSGTLRPSMVKPQILGTRRMPNTDGSIIRHLNASHLVFCQCSLFRAHDVVCEVTHLHFML
jgi:hypothetical protein